LVPCRSVSVKNPLEKMAVPMDPV